MHTPKPPAPSQPPLPPDQQALPAHPLPPVDDLPPVPMASAPPGQQSGQPVQAPAVRSARKTVVQAAVDAFAAIKANMPSPAAPPVPMAPHDPVGFGQEYLRNGFDADVAERAANTGIGTGFAAMDQIQPFHGGFTVPGALPSIGKSGFCIQWADQLAFMYGQPSLYFALEQTKLDCYSRSLARFFFYTHMDEALQRARGLCLPAKYAYYHHDELSKYPTPSAAQIQSGYAARAYPKEMAHQADRYMRTVGNKACVLQCDFGVTVEDIRYVVETYISEFNVKPVVFVDYLQILAPSPQNGRIPDSKTALDHICRGLKELYLDLGVKVVCISSFNRQNYLTPTDMEAFSGTAGIEYTADQMLAMQLSAVTMKGFYNVIDKNGREGRETSLAFKRKLLKAAKAMDPRRVQLVCLKNRFGISSYECDFLYFPVNDCFRSITDKANELFPMTIDEETGGFEDVPPLPGSGGNATFEDPGDGDDDDGSPGGNGGSGDAGGSPAGEAADGTVLTDQERADLEAMSALAGIPAGGNAAEAPADYDCGQKDY